MSKEGSNKIRFVGLKPGTYEYCFQLDNLFFEGFENDEIRGGNVRIDAKMEKLENMLLLTFDLKGEVTTTCDRCMGEMSVEVDGSEHLSIRFSDNEQSDKEDEAVLPEGSEEIDLTQWLYEYVAVRIPMRHTHSEGECDSEVTRYIDTCDKHADGYVDPRWEALKGLK